MKKLFLLLWGLACFAAPSFAQTVTGSLTAASASCLATNCVPFTIPNAQIGNTGAVGVQLTGTFSATVQFEGSVDGTNWAAISASPASTGVQVTSATATGVWQVNIAGLLGFRVRCSTFGSGPVTVSIQASSSPPSDKAVTATIAGTGPVVVGSALGVVVSYEPLTSGGITVAMTATTSTAVGALGTGTASQYEYISSCTVSNGSTTVSTDIALQDGSGGTTIWIFPAGAASVATTGGGGATHSFGDHPLKVPTSGNGLYAANVTTGSSTKIFCNGFKSTVSY